MEKHDIERALRTVLKNHPDLEPRPEVERDGAKWKIPILFGPGKEASRNYKEMLIDLDGTQPLEQQIEEHLQECKKKWKLENQQADLRREIGRFQRELRKLSDGLKEKPEAVTIGNQSIRDCFGSPMDHHFEIEVTRLKDSQELSRCLDEYRSVCAKLIDESY